MDTFFLTLNILAIPTAIILSLCGVVALASSDSRFQPLGAAIMALLQVLIAIVGVNIWTYGPESSSAKLLLLLVAGR